MIFRKFKAKDGNEVILREPEPRDYEDYQKVFNECINEGWMGRIIPLTEEDAVEFVEKGISAPSKKEGVVVCAETDNKIVAMEGTFREHTELKNHIAETGIMILKKYRRAGIATEVMKEALKQAKKIGIEIIYIETQANNKPMIGLAKKVGFKKYGLLKNGAKRGRKHFDMILMSKQL